MYTREVFDRIYADVIRGSQNSFLIEPSVVHGYPLPDPLANHASEVYGLDAKDRFHYV
jgi:hypothetical protein